MILQIRATILDHCMRRFARHIFVGFLLFSVVTTVHGQGAPIEGAALVSLTNPSATPRIDHPYDLEIVFDLRGVSGKAGEESTPAVLAAYQIEIAFDPALISFVSARGGETSEFALTPITTAPNQANANGRVVLVASHASPTSPTGLVSGGYVTFLATAPATVTFEVKPLSLSSALQFCCGGVFGPVSIPATGSSWVAVFSKPPSRRRPVRRPDTAGSDTSEDSKPD